VSINKEKYRRSKAEPPQKKGNADVISKIVNNTAAQENVNTVLQEDVNTVRNVKKATFELDADLHKRIRIFAVENETTMVDLVTKAVIEYLDRYSK
jgi:hypothetical protein